MNMAILQQCTPPPGTSLPSGLFTSISFEEPEKGVIESFTTSTIDTTGHYLNLAPLLS